MIIPVKKELNNAGLIDAEIELICPKKIQQNQMFFTDCFLAKFPPEISCENNRPIFLKNLPLKILLNF